MGLGRIRLYVLAILMIDLPATSQQVSPPPFAAPRSNEVELFLRNVWTEKTTELGADEVYVLVIAKSSAGKSISRRIPADAPHQPSGHWDMNDNKALGCNRPSGDSHCIENKSLGVFSTRHETWDVVIAFMEEDQGIGKHPEDIVIDSAQESGGNWIAAVINILKGFATNDTDDFIGSVTAHIRPGRVTWREGERIRQFVPYPKDPLRLFGFQMIGDGANYTAHIGLR